MESWVLETTGFLMEKKSRPILILVAGAEQPGIARMRIFAVITQRILKDQPDHAATYRIIAAIAIINLHAPNFVRACIMSPRISQHQALAECFRVMGEAEGERLTREEIVRQAIQASG